MGNNLGDFDIYIWYDIPATCWHKVLCELLPQWWRTRAIFRDLQIGHITWKRNMPHCSGTNELRLLGCGYSSSQTSKTPECLESWIYNAPGPSAMPNLDQISQITVEEIQNRVSRDPTEPYGQIPLQPRISHLRVSYTKNSTTSSALQARDSAYFASPFISLHR